MIESRVSGAALPVNQAIPPCPNPRHLPPLTSRSRSNLHSVYRPTVARIARRWPSPAPPRLASALSLQIPSPIGLLVPRLTKTLLTSSHIPSGVRVCGARQIPVFRHVSVNLIHNHTPLTEESPLTSRTSTYHGLLVRLVIQLTEE